MTENIVFGRIIRFHRKAVRLTREECAELCGISRTYMGEIERGEVQPRFVTVAKLCEICKINIRTLYELYYPEES